MLCEAQRPLAGRLQLVISVAHAPTRRGVYLVMSGITGDDHRRPVHILYTLPKLCINYSV